MSVKFFLFLSLFSFTVSAANLDFDLRYHASQTRLNSLDETATLSGPLIRFFQGKIAARLAQSDDGLAGLDYAGEIKFPFLSFFKLGARVTHKNYLSEVMANTTLLFTFGAEANPLSFLGLFLNVGWYERFGLLGKSTIIPTFFRSSFREHDLGAALGFRVNPTKSLTTTFTVGTFENIEIYNLNNPFAEISVSHPLPGTDFTGSVFGRYQILLGFGRLDEFMFGFSIGYPLEGTNPST